MTIKQLLIFDKCNADFVEPKLILNNYLSLTQNSVLGGEDTLSFTIPQSAFVFEAEDFVLFDQKRYVIKRHTKIRDDKGIAIQVDCEGLYTMLMDYVIDGDDTWLQGASMSTVLTRILRGTRFSLGRCDDFGTWDIELKELNCLEAINEVRNNWPAKPEIYFDGYTLNAVAVRGNDTGYQLHYKRNMIDIERTVDTSDVVTRLIGLGENGLTIEGLEASQVTNTDGVHIEDGKVSKKYIDAPTVGDYAIPKTVIEEFSDYTDQKALLEAMQRRLMQIYLPNTIYTVTYAEMVRQNVPYSDINVGDFVYINDPEFGQLKLRVAEIQKDPFNIENSVVTLGDRQKTLEDYLSDFNESKPVLDSLKPGMIDGIVQGALDKALQWLNNGQNTCWITDDDGIICADRTTLGPDNQIINTTRLIKMSSGAIGCSVDGGQTYKTAMTPEGVVAEVIVGSQISSSLVSVGDDSKFADGYSPTDVRKPLVTEFDLHKQNTNTTVGNTERELQILNTSVAQTNTAIDLVDKKYKNEIDILNQDLSGLNGNISSLTNMYNKVNSDLYGNSYFRWTEQGIHATDYEYPAYQMQLGAKGIGFSTDGGHIFNNAITARGIVASQVNIGTFGEEPFKGLTIRNGLGEETLAIDTNGNISLMGNINMNGGSINWQNVSKITYDALDLTMRDKFTWIDSNGVYTGTVQAKQINLKDGFFEATNAKGETTFSITSNGDVIVKGSIHMGAGSTIDWSGVNKLTPEEIGAMSDKEFEEYKTLTARRLTKITEDGIYTGTVDAGKIVVTGPKIPASALDITASDIGAASKTELNNLASTIESKVQSANSYSKQLADELSRELSYLESDMVTHSNVTTITHNAIKTAKLSANQIVSGKIAGVDIYCDNLLCIGSEYSARNPRIEFEPGNTSTIIEYRNWGDGYLAMACEESIALWGRKKTYFQTKMDDVLFSKYGSSQAGTGTYISMGDVVDKINQLCKKAGISTL